MKRDVGYWMRAAADMILPRVCVVCGRRLLLQEKHICLGCAADMPFTRFETMSHNPMADRLNEVIQRHLAADGVSSRLPQSYERYAYASALFLYKEDNGYKRIPYQIKYHGNLTVGRHFGRMLGQRLAGSQLFNDVNMVIPVPLHRLRRWKRGYNQAEIIAGEVAAALKAEKLMLLTDTEGVKNMETGELLHVLTEKEVYDLIDSGIITGGMIPKVLGCLDAIDSGVKSVHILDGRIPHCLLLEIFTTDGIGTMFKAE